MKIAALLFPLLLAAAPTPPGASLSALLDQLRAEETADKKAEALLTIRRLAALAPEHSAITARHARLASANGALPEALAALRRLDAMEASADLSHADFAAVKALPEAAPLFARLVTHGREQGRVAPAYALATSELVVEGMARDPVSGDLYFADMHGMRIIRRSPDGKETLAALPADWAVTGLLGLKPDPQRNRLWACAARADGAGERAMLLLLDLKTLTPIRRIEFPSGQHLCNDVDVLGDGRAIVTDSEGRQVWAASAEGGLTPIVPAGAFLYPNGVAVAADGRHAYVATVTGIVRLDSQTGGFEPLALGGRSAAGIDGLYRRGDTLYAVQNSFTPMRVIAIHLTGPTAGELRTLAAASPLFELPTTAALDGDTMLLIANAQFRKLDKGKLRAGEKLDPTRVLRVPI